MKTAFQCVVVSVALTLVAVTLLVAGLLYIAFMVVACVFSWPLLILWVVVDMTRAFMRQEPGEDALIRAGQHGLVKHR